MRKMVNLYHLIPSIPLWKSKVLSRFLMMLFLLLLCITMSGCKKLDNNPSSPSASHQMEFIQPQQDKKPSFELVTSKSGMAYTKYAGTEAGYYEVLTNTNGSGNILYTDYSSRKTIYLSSQPDSTHNDSTDESWIESVTGGSSIFTVNNKLYIVKRGKPELVAAYGDAGQALFLQMELDGSSRKSAKLKPNERFVDGSAMVSDGQQIFFLLYRFDEDGNAFENLVLSSLNIDTMQLQDVTIFPPEQSMSIIGVSEDSIVFQFARKFDSAVDKDYDTYMESFSYQLLRYYPYDKSIKLELCFTWDPSIISGIVYKNKFYFYNTLTNELKFFDFHEKREALLEKTIQPNNSAYNQIALTGDVVDDHLFFNCTNPQTGESQKISYNIKTNTIIEHCLLSNGKFVGIFEENTDYYLVMTGEKNIQTPDIAPDGSPFFTDRIVFEFSLIEKSDYWANRSNYLPIDDTLVYGF